VPSQRKIPAAISVKARYPGFIEPALATSADKVPSGTRWIHEIKFDGYRVQVHIKDGKVKVYTRRGNDWTNRFRKIASDSFEINAGSAIIDGEVVVPGPNGLSDFSVLQNELKGRSTKIVLVGFDLLYLSGHDLRRLPLAERKAHLKQLVAGTEVQFSDSFELDGQEMYQHACKVGLEGVVSKVRDSAYVSGEAILGSRKRASSARRWRSRASQRPGPRLCRQGRPRIRQEVRRRSAQAAQATDPEDPALYKENRPQGHLG
jgi:bifunctional non-homologous end joining protein LigD